MADLIVGAIVVCAVGSAAAYIIREKKRGVSCIGCPHAGTCGGGQKQGCGCRTEKND